MKFARPPNTESSPQGPRNLTWVQQNNRIVSITTISFANSQTHYNNRERDSLDCDRGLRSRKLTTVLGRGSTASAEAMPLSQDHAVHISHSECTIVHRAASAGITSSPSERREIDCQAHTSLLRFQLGRHRVLHNRELLLFPAQRLTSSLFLAPSSIHVVTRLYDCTGRADKHSNHVSTTQSLLPHPMMHLREPQKVTPSASAWESHVCACTLPDP